MHCIALYCIVLYCIVLYCIVLYYIAGICGGSASGKTTVAKKIISELGIPWVIILSLDSFYKVVILCSRNRPRMFE